ncbi:hypothetical protein [Parvularcula marina]|uniref:hypothetical protein n=1 Tax=Parvularcula marina TaxID=2292771 RepID=UPI003512437D
MSSLILHVGLGKTGSSSIQQGLAALNNEGQAADMRINYPRAEFGAGLFGAEMISAFGPFGGVDEQGAVEEALARSASQAEITIISGEMIAHTQNLAKVRLLDRLQDHFNRIEIIAYVRHPGDWNAATAAQLFIDGVPLSDLVRWPYIETQIGLLSAFREFAQLSKKVSLTVQRFEDAISHPYGLTGHFGELAAQKFRLTDFRLEDGLHVNPSLCALQYLAIGRANELFVRTSAEGAIARQKISDLRLGEEQAKRRFAQIYAEAEARSAIMYDYCGLNSWYGIKYSDLELFERFDDQYLVTFQSQVTDLKTVDEIILLLVEEGFFAQQVT